MVCFRNLTKTSFAFRAFARCVLYPVFDFMSFCIVKAVQVSNKITRDPSNSGKRNLTKPKPLLARPIPIINKLGLDNPPMLRFLDIPNLLHDVLSGQPVFVDYLNMIQCVSPLHRNRLKQVHLRVEIAIATDSNISSVHILQVGFL